MRQNVFHPPMDGATEKQQRCGQVKMAAYLCLFIRFDTTQQITEQINKEISPWLYSKGMKLAKNILKAASKIALKYDIDGDGKDEGSVTCDLDSILLLKEEIQK